MSMTVDLKVVGGAKSANVNTVGQKVNLEVWATVKGANASTADDGFQTLWGSLLSTNVNGGAANGTLTFTPAAPFNGSGAASGVSQDLDADGDKDAGSKVANAWDNDLIVARSDGVVSGTSFKVGTAVFTVTSLKSTTGSTNLQFRVSNTSLVPLWKEDGKLKNRAFGGTFSTGGAVVIKRGTGGGGGGGTTYTLSGNVFNDTDGDGVKDAGETNRSGVKVFIDADKDGILDTGEKSATTNTSGNYSFSGLAAGSVRVRVVQPAGYRVSNPTLGYHDFTLNGNTAKNFGVTQKVLITGRAWVDSDKDGVKDTAEAVLSGWTVYIDKDKDGRFDAGESWAKTDASGNYKFYGLAAGSHRVRIVQNTGYTRVGPTSGYFEKTLTNGQKWESNNFRFTKP